MVKVKKNEQFLIQICKRPETGEKLWESAEDTEGEKRQHLKASGTCLRPEFKKCGSVETELLQEPGESESDLR